MPYIHWMKWISRLFMLAFFSLVLIVVLLFASLMLLIATLRWLITGQKPGFHMHLNAFQQWRNMASRQSPAAFDPDDVIEAEVREVSKDQTRLH